MNETPGLHVHFIPRGASLRVAVWQERYARRDEYMAAGGSRTGILHHPGVVTGAPGWLPPGSVPVTFLAKLPRLGNGHPLALPGVITTWTQTKTQWGARKSDVGVYEVMGWAIPIELSLGPLRVFLSQYREAHGEGLLAPMSEPLIRMLTELQRRVEQGPLLPGVWTPGPPREGRGGIEIEAPQAPGWVPAISAEEVLRWAAEIRAFAGAAVPSAARWIGPAMDDLMATPVPARFAHFIADLCAAAAGPGDGVQAVAPALMKGLHRSHGSCLYPSHPLFSPADHPSGHLHMSVNAAEDGSYRGELALRDKEARLPVRELRKWGTAPLVEHRGHLWQQPARLLERGLEAMMQQGTGTFERPEALSGELEFTAEEAEGWLATGDIKAYETFLSKSGRKASRPFVALSVGLGDQAEIRPRVRWQHQLTGDGAIARARFSPELSLVVGEHELSLPEVASLLSGAKGKLVQLAGQMIERQGLQLALDLAHAREKVIEKLARGGTLDWGQALALEDEWASEEEDFSSVFSETWAEVLGRIEDGAGVPKLGAPRGFKGELRPYQERGVSWLGFLVEQGLGGCLADDMGLGKTVQVLALLEHRRAAGGVALVICPTAVVGNWVKEAKKFVPGLRAIAHQGSERASGAAFQRQLARCDLVVTSYALALLDQELFQPVEWGVLIIDEAQHIKNPAAKRTRAIKGLKAQARVALTGTPVENRLGDLWSIYDLLNPGLLGGQTRFARSFSAPISRGSEAASARLQRRLGPFLLRRTKRDPRIALDLPDKQEQDIECLLTAEQTALYRAMTEATLAGLEDKNGIARRAHILAALTHFKQICDHPEVFEPDRPGRLFGRSGKLDRACDLLEELLDEGQGVLVFTQFVAMGKLLSAAIEERLGVQALFYHGGLTPRAREAMVTDFQSPDGPPVMIVSLKAGGTGLNLTRASAVLHYDRWWNPAVEDQATDRAHRIGQTQKVNVYRFLTRGTVEERIQELIEQKRSLAGQVLGGVGDEGWLTEMDNQQLARLFALDEAPQEDPQDDA